MVHSQPMRHNLAIKNRQRLIFRGTVERFGRGHGKRTGAKVVLVNFHQKGSSKVSDHLWFDYRGASWQSLGEIFNGDLIELTGRVKPYTKGGLKSKSYKELQEDFEISYVNNIKLVKEVRLPKGWIRNADLAWMDETQFDKWSKFHMHRQFDIDEGKIGLDKERNEEFQRQKRVNKLADKSK